jgi:hypothetical protein
MEAEQNLKKEEFINTGRFFKEEDDIYYGAGMLK